MLAEGSLSRWKDLKQREQMLAELTKHGSVTNFGAETVTHTGRHIHVIFSAKLQSDTITGMVMDITERKQAEESLRISETNLVKAQEVATPLRGEINQITQRFERIEMQQILIVRHEPGRLVYLWLDFIFLQPLFEQLVVIQ